MRLLRLAERQHAIDDSTNLTLRDELHSLQQLRLRSHERSEQRQMTVEHLPQISPRIETARRPTSHQSSIVLERRNRSGPRRSAGVLDDNIHALASGKSLHFLRPIITRVIDRLIGSDLTRFRKLLVRTRRRN